MTEDHPMLAGNLLQIESIFLKGKDCLPRRQTGFANARNDGEK